ncbi:MAG: hypothetical protein AB1403_15360 [Candidatus Riflebacteria bacterium]
MKKFESKTGVAFLTGILCLIAVIAQGQITDSTIRFSTPSLNLVFQPPLRSGFNSEHPLEIELPQLNLAVNLFENYMQYLLKLQKIATGTTLQIIYAPGQSSESWDENPNLIKLSDTGMNQILQKVNRFLADKNTTDAAYLLDNAESLLKIPDNFSRRTCQIADKIELANLSSFIDSLEPDCDMAIADAGLVFVTRPHKNGNRILRFSEQNNVCSGSIVLEPGKAWYSGLRPDKRGQYLAFTEGNEPMLIKMGKSEPVKFFPQRKTLLMAMEWSPQQPVLAGMVLDLDTQERLFFVYDAENQKMVDLAGIENLKANHLYAHPFWSPDGNRLIMTTGRQINLIDLTESRVYHGITSLPNEISELIWSADGNSFAVVEIIGQARSKTVFDDYDLRKSVLHRFKINKDFSVTEDHAQSIDSRNSIKLLSFWTNDRVLYLEGHLISKKLNTPFWDLSKSFTAYLTPPPTQSISREDSAKVKKSEPTALPMKYLYVFRNLDGKFNNVYDAGFAHTNHVYTEDFYNLWFIGLRRPDELEANHGSFNLRASPYPFPEKNQFIFVDYPSAKMEKFCRFLEDYSLRFLRITDDCSNLYFLANFCGPLNVWEGSLNAIITGLAGTPEVTESQN